MDTEELLVEEAGQGELVEHLHGEVVGLLIVLAETCIGEEIHSCRKLK